LDEAQAVNPDNAEVYYYRGVLAAHRKDYKAAAESLERAVKLEPDHAYAHYHAGLAYNLLKRPDKMLEHFQAFLKLAPDAPEAQKIRTVVRSAR
jgi:lipoprotein NlpI